MKYFVSYTFKSDSVPFGFGSIEMTLKDGIKKFDDLLEIRKIINEKNNCESIIIFYKELAE